MGLVKEAMGRILVEAARNEWSEYDVAAASYVELKRRVCSEELFLAMCTLPAYSSLIPCPSDGDEPNDTVHAAVHQNPNLDVLKQLESRLCEVLRQLRDGHIRRSEAYASMWVSCERVGLAPFGDERINESTLLWTVIRAIDRITDEDTGFDSSDYRGTLNKLACTGEVGVYTSRQIGRKAATPFDGLGVARIPEMRLNDQLSSLVFLLKEDVGTLPELVTVRPADGGGGGAADSFRIGAEFFTGAPIAGTEQDEAMVNIRPGLGSTFTIAYSQGYDDLFAPLVRQSIDNAIRHRCDILLFPEILISPGLLKVIEEYLKSPEIKDCLKLVVAGSTWYCEDGRLTGRNESTILNGRGSVVGITHKRKPFLFKTKANGGKEVVLLEALSDDVKHTCTVVDLAGIGRIVVGICKDMVSDDRTIIDLARDIRANIVLVPAFSDSIDRGFRLHFEVLAERGIAVSCLCNYCGACKAHEKKCGEPSDEVEVGYAYAPKAGEGHPRQARPDPVVFKRTKECSKSCARQLQDGNPQSCLKVVEIRQGRDGVALTIEEIA